MKTFTILFSTWIIKNNEHFITVKKNFQVSSFVTVNDIKMRVYSKLQNKKNSSLIFSNLVHSAF